MKKMLMLLACLLIASFCWAQTKASFSYRYEKGNTYRYATVADVKMAMDMAGQSMNTESNARTIITLKALDLNSDGDITLEASYDSLILKINGMRMDTTMVMSELMGKRAKVVVNKFGKTKTIAAIDSMPKSMMIMQTMNGDPMLYMRRVLSDLPNVALAVGEKWINTSPDTIKNAMMEIVIAPNIEYTLAGRETVAGQECARFNLSGPMTLTGKGSRMGAEFFIEGEGKSSGSIFFNEKRGIVVAVEGSSEQQMNIAVTGGSNMTITQNQTVKSKMNLLP